jgi:hypothetical protein
MGTIPSYPPSRAPLDGTEELAGWQNGKQVSVPVAALSTELADAGAATSAAQAAQSRNEAAADRAAVADDKAIVESMIDQVQIGQTAYALYFYDGARSYVPQGAVVGAIASEDITGGASGTDGTFGVTFSGGNFAVNPTGIFTVTGGVVTAVNITGPGLYLGDAISAPTLDFSASDGLTGASATLTTEYLVPSGKSYITSNGDDAQRASLYRNNANAAELVQADFGPMDTALSKAWAASPDEPDPDNAPGEQSAKTYAGDAATSAASIDDRMAIYDALPEVDDASYVMVDGENNIVGSVSNEGELDFPIPSDNVPYLPAIFDTLDQALDDLTLVDDDDNIVGSNGGGSDDGEVVAARGIRTDLDSRLSESLTDYGQPRRGLYAPERLVTTRALIAQILAGDDVQLRIGWIGDSWTAFTSVGVHAYYMPIVGDRIAAITGMPLAAPGWIGFTKGGQDDSIGVVVGDWATDTSGGGKGPDTCKVTGTAAAGDFTVTGVPAGLSGIRLYHEGGGAEISYAWNGGDANSLTLTGAGETIVDLPAIDAGTLVISVTSGTAVLNGLSLDSTASGVVIDNLADSGSNLLQWVSVPESDWQAAITAGAYDLVVIGPFGTNDQPAYDAAAFKGYGQTLIDRVSAALPNADILLAASPENVAGRPRPMRDYQEALRQLAAVNACAMLDLQYYFRTSSDWLDETTVHPTRIGSAAVSEAFIRTLFCEV